MNFKEKYPEFAPIYQHIRAARLERAVYLSQLIADAVLATVDGLKRLASLAAGKTKTAPGRPQVRADAFLKRSVPRY